jgi:hypothetical protein
MDLDSVTLTAMAQGWTSQGAEITGVDAIELPITPGAPGIDLSVSGGSYFDMSNNEGECSTAVVLTEQPGDGCIPSNLVDPEH